MKTKKKWIVDRCLSLNDEGKWEASYTVENTRSTSKISDPEARNRSTAYRVCKLLNKAEGMK